MVTRIATLSDELGIPTETLAFHRMSLFLQFQPQPLKRKQPTSGWEPVVVGWLAGDRLKCCTIVQRRLHLGSVRTQHRSVNYCCNSVTDVTKGLVCV